jgi:hypothetical protein
MPRFCHGRFSEETKQLLKDDKGIAFLRQPCAVCGLHVVAENKAGEWVPTTHHQPQGRRPLKGRGVKR